MKPHYTILVVDDNSEIRDIIKQFLELDGKNVIEAGNGLEALDKMSNEVDLVIMDMSMPYMSGDEACRLIRTERTVPVIFLTAYGDDETKKRCFEYGADDFLTKPFKYSELLLHINALLRRCYEYTPESTGKAYIQADIQHDKEAAKAKSDIDSDILRVDDYIKLDEKRKKIYFRDKDLHITYTEYSIFKFLYSNKGRVYAIDELYENVWNEKYCEESANTVMVHIRNLRKKLEKTGREYIYNQWGKGYYYDD